MIIRKCTFTVFIQVIIIIYNVLYNVLVRKKVRRPGGVFFLFFLYSFLIFVNL